MLFLLVSKNCNGHAWKTFVFDFSLLSALLSPDDDSDCNRTFISLFAATMEEEGICVDGGPSGLGRCCSAGSFFLKYLKRDMVKLTSLDQD